MASMIGIRLAFVAVVALVFAACALVQPAPGGPLVTIETRGGRCVEGECRTVVAIERDGRVHRLAPDVADMTQVQPRIVTAIEVAIASTDYAGIRAKPFTGECPTAFDGQEVVFTFSTASGEERIASCEVEIDEAHPLFVAVQAALGASPP